MKFISFFLDTLFYFINYTLALIFVYILNLFHIKWKNNVWIIGGNGGKFYSDNSAEMHNYILNNYPEIEIYWVIKKDSPDVYKAKGKGPILYKHSLKGTIYVLQAKVLICNHSIRGDILRSKMKTFRNSFTVNLFHGVTAFKEKLNPQGYNGFNMLVATSNYEKEIKNKLVENKEVKICVTGFPRYDTLYRYKDQKTELNHIFFMPTWRPWLKNKYGDPTEEDYRQFRNSNFYKEVNSLLVSSELDDFLKNNNYLLNVYFHQNFDLFTYEFLKNIYSSNINILSPGANVQDQLLKSKLLITDYSSIAWDFLFLNRPVIFYQFDHEIYNNYYNSYISMPQDLFGPVTYNAKDTVNEVKKLVQITPDIIEERNKNIKRKFIGYDDENNRKRVMDTILELKN